MSTQDFNEILHQAEQLGPTDQAALLAKLTMIVSQKNKTSELDSIQPVGAATDLAADFWPIDESLDEMTTAIELLRQQGRPRMPA